MQSFYHLILMMRHFAFLFRFREETQEALSRHLALRQIFPCQYRDAPAATGALAELRASKDAIHRCRHPAYRRLMLDSIAKYMLVAQVHEHGP